MKGVVGMAKSASVYARIDPVLKNRQKAFYPHLDSDIECDRYVF